MNFASLRAILLGVIYAGLGVLFVRAALKRRAAVRHWRAAIGGDFDRRQGCFATELELDRRTLPPAAAAALAESRHSLMLGLGATAFALVFQMLTLGY